MEVKHTVNQLYHNPSTQPCMDLLVRLRGYIVCIFLLSSKTTSTIASLSLVPSHLRCVIECEVTNIADWEDSPKDRARPQASIGSVSSVSLLLPGTRLSPNNLKFDIFGILCLFGKHALENSFKQTMNCLWPEKRKNTELKRGVSF